METPKQPPPPTNGVLLSAAVTAGVTVGVMILEPWEGDSSNGANQAEPSDSPRLTTQEAIGLIASDCPKRIMSAFISENAAATYEGDGKWTVRLKVDSRIDRWTVDETTATVIPLDSNYTDSFACRELQIID